MDSSRDDVTTTLLRAAGKEALSCYLHVPTNVTILEQSIYNQHSAHGDPMAYASHVYSVIGDIVAGTSIRDTLSMIKANAVHWDHPMYEDVKVRLQEQDDFSKNPFEVVEGIIACGKCGCKKIITFAKQLRSGDEATTVFAQCIQCNERWRYN